MDAIVRGAKLAAHGVVLRTRGAETAATGPISAVPADGPTVAPPPLAAERDAELRAALEAQIERLRETEMKGRAENDELRSELEALRAALEDLRRQAHDEGHRAGLAEGRAQAAVQFAHEIGRARQIADALAEAVRERLDQLEPAAVHIALEAACKFIGGRLASPDGVAAMVRGVLEAVADAEQATIRLSPEDLAVLTASGDAPMPRQGAQWSLIADDRVGAGGCVVETATGIWDATPETRLKALLGALDAARQAANGRDA
jgi:flagellar assembly protein FliH